MLLGRFQHAHAHAHTHVCTCTYVRTSLPTEEEKRNRLSSVSSDTFGFSATSGAPGTLSSTSTTAILHSATDLGSAMNLHSTAHLRPVTNIRPVVNNDEEEEKILSYFLSSPMSSEGIVRRRISAQNWNPSEEVFLFYHSEKKDRRFTSSLYFWIVWEEKNHASTHLNQFCV